MSEQGVEFYSYPHVAAMGRRKMVVPFDPSPDNKKKNWEVYVRLVSGSTFIMQAGLTKGGSGKLLAKLATEMAGETGCSFVTTPEAAIPFEHVARVYMDTQENAFVTVVEDSSGASYIIEEGSQAKCRAAVEMVAGAILQYIAQREGE